MGDINTDWKTFGLTSRQFHFIAGISALWFAFCLSLLLPPVRSLIIGFGETLAHRPINNPYWHETFISIAIGQIFLWSLIFGLFLSTVFFQISAGRISNILAVTFSLIFMFAIMYTANWSFSDEATLILTTAVNKYAPINIIYGGDGGRFCPLGFIHYNLLLLVFRCLGINTGLPVEAHFIVIAVFFMVTFLSLYFLFRRIEPVKTEGVYPALNCFFACTFFLLGSYLYHVFFHLVYFETVIIMSFAVFMLMYYKALKTDKIRYYAIAFLSAVYSTYCKEPVFGVFLVVAFVNYLFRRNKKTKREKVFYIALAANGALFLTMYYFLSFRNASWFYNAGMVSISGIGFLLSVFKETPALIIMLCFGLFRLYSVIARKERDHLFYDSLLFAGMAYALAILTLHLRSGYYFYPSLILFLPSLVHWIKYFLERKRAFAATLFFILLLIYSYNSTLAATHMRDNLRQKQEFMPYIANLLSEYNKGKEFVWYESNNRTTDDTFFIAVRDWKKYGENTFLNYLNKSEGIDFFVVEKSMDRIAMDQNTLFFYAVENDQYQPMRDELVKVLQDNNFTLYNDFNGILIYRQY